MSWGGGDDRNGVVTSCDQVRLVDHDARLTAANPDEYAFVEPAELRGRGLDPCGGAEDVLARIDVLAARESLEHLGAAVSDASRVHVEERTPVVLNRVADLAEGGAVRQNDLPVRVRPRNDLPVQLGTRERAPGPRNDPPPATVNVADIDRLSECCFQSVDPRQLRLRQPSGHCTSHPGSFEASPSRPSEILTLESSRDAIATASP